MVVTTLLGIVVAVMAASPAQRLQAARQTLAELRALARTHGLSQPWVLAAFATAAHESGFDPTANLRVRTDGTLEPGPSGSRGIWQLNSAAHPDVSAAQAADPVTSTRIWFDRMNPGATYLQCGGDDAFLRNPVAFMRCFAPKTQISWPWNDAMAAGALTLAGSVMQQIDRNMPPVDAIIPADCVQIGGNTVCPPDGGTGSAPQGNPWDWFTDKLPGVPTPGDVAAEIIKKLIGTAWNITPDFAKETGARVGLFAGGSLLFLMGVGAVLYSSTNRATTVVLKSPAARAYIGARTGGKAGTAGSNTDDNAATRS